MAGRWNDIDESASEWLHWPHPMVWRRAYPGHDSAVRAARKFPASLLKPIGLAGDAEWIAGELISNALKYTRSAEQGGWFGVEVGLSREIAWVGVRDLGGVLIPAVIPLPDEPDLAAGGRGLAAVLKLASVLHVDGSAEAGHTVRAFLDLPAKPGERTS